MIELKHDRLHLSFPEVHEKAVCVIDLLRTLRLPEDERQYPLPPDLGRFSLRKVDDLKSSVPRSWLERGGVLVPMFQAEALWVRFEGNYPFAVKLGTQGINALNGDLWSDGLSEDKQDYVVTTSQPWVDGYRLDGEALRQFTALPLESDHAANVQLAGQSDIGALLLHAYPLAASFYGRTPDASESAISSLEPVSPDAAEPGVEPGGKVRLRLYSDPWGREAWDTEHSAKCYVRTCNSLIWRALLGTNPPQIPLTEEDYEAYRYPWIDSFDEPAQSEPQIERMKNAIAAATAGSGEDSAQTAKLDEQNAIILPEPRSLRYRVSEDPN